MYLIAVIGFGYEVKNNTFFDKEESYLLNLNIYSPIHKLDQYGTACTGKYYDTFGFIHLFSKKIDNEIVIYKKIILSYSREEAKEELKRSVSCDKLTGMKYKKSSSRGIFDHLSEDYIFYFPEEVPVRRIVVDEYQ
ncbi:MAG: hypothetical protein GY828_02410 [Candidatus Gracilibacteria bacterium]|nr:hypothetical protein [Candidatus Gracilibacteria bacterium]